MTTRQRYEQLQKFNPQRLAGALIAAEMLADEVMSRSIAKTAMIEELMLALEEIRDDGLVRFDHSVIDKARALIARPEKPNA